MEKINFPIRHGKAFWEVGKINR